MSLFQWSFVQLNLGSPHSLYRELLFVENAPQLIVMEVVEIVEAQEFLDRDTKSKFQLATKLQRTATYY